MLADEEQSGMLAGSAVVVIASRLRDRRLKRWIVDSVADWWILHSGFYQRSYQRCELAVAEIEDSSASNDARRGFVEICDFVPQVVTKATVAFFPSPFKSRSSQKHFREASRSPTAFKTALPSTTSKQPPP
ncbi:hypothetical protein RYX36_037228 [Vicia faba]